MHPVARLPDEWKETLAARSERPFRAQQIFKWIHARGVLDPTQMSDLAEPLRAWLVVRRSCHPYLCASALR